MWFLTALCISQVQMILRVVEYKMKFLGQLRTYWIICQMWSVSRKWPAREDL